MLTTGTFASNIRATSKDDLDELRQLMRDFGWIDHHPAVIDENGVVIVGHRRLAVAKELGIEPKTVTVEFGHGDPADAERMRLALASNLGNKPLNAADRKRIATRLYGTGEWTQEAIARALNTAQANISRDLSEFIQMDKPKKSYRPKGGRPPGSSKPPREIKPLSEQHSAAAALVLDKGLGAERAGKQVGLTRIAVREAVAKEEGRRLAAAPSGELQRALAEYDRLSDEDRSEFCKLRCGREIIDSAGALPTN